MKNKFIILMSIFLPCGTTFTTETETATMDSIEMKIREGQPQSVGIMSRRSGLDRAVLCWGINSGNPSTQEENCNTQVEIACDKEGKCEIWGLGFTCFSNKNQRCEKELSALCKACLKYAGSSTELGETWMMKNSVVARDGMVFEEPSNTNKD